MITKGTRIINFAVDAICISILGGVISLIFSPIYSSIIYYCVYIIYYLTFELVLCQTVGKLITQTIVVQKNNEKPTFGKILYRTFLRLNPFDGFSYLFGQEQGTHDVASKTRLINKYKTIQ